MKPANETAYTSAFSGIGTLTTLATVLLIALIYLAIITQ